MIPSLANKPARIRMLQFYRESTKLAQGAGLLLAGRAQKTRYTRRGPERMPGHTLWLT